MVGQKVFTEFYLAVVGNQLHPLTKSHIHVHPQNTTVHTLGLKLLVYLESKTVPPSKNFSTSQICAPSEAKTTHSTLTRKSCRVLCLKLLVEGATPPSPPGSPGRAGGATAKALQAQPLAPLTGHAFQATRCPFAAIPAPHRLNPPTGQEGATF